MQPEENDCGEIELSLGIPADSEMPAFDSTQIGLWARVAFRDPKQWAGKDMYACGDVITPRKIAQTLSELSGKKYVPAPITREEFMQMSERMDYELWLNYLAFVNGYVNFRILLMVASGNATPLRPASSCPKRTISRPGVSTTRPLRRTLGRSGSTIVCKRLLRQLYIWDMFMFNCLGHVAFIHLLADLLCTDCHRACEKPDNVKLG